MEKRTLDVPWASLWRIFFFGLLVVLLVLGRKIVLALFLAIAISSGTEFIIDFLEKRRIPRVLAVISVYFFSILLVAALIYFLVPFVLADLSKFVSAFGDSPLGDIFGSLASGDNSVTSWINRISTQLLSGGPSLGAVQGVIGGVGLAITILAISFYLSLTPNGVEKFVRAIVPQEREEDILRLYDRSMIKIKFWFRTQIMISLIVGILTWAALFLLGVPHALLLGVIAGIFEIIPFVGPILAGAAALLFAFVTSPSLALYTALAFLAIQQFESNVLVPLVTRKTVGLHPVVIIVSLLIGLELAGLLGALVAIPAAAVFQEIVEDRSGRRAQANS